MDNLWRSTQSLYVTFPLHFYSFTKAAEAGKSREPTWRMAGGAAILLPSLKDYLRYHFYGADVTFEPPYESSRFVKKIGDALQLCI